MNRIGEAQKIIAARRAAGETFPELRRVVELSVGLSRSTSRELKGKPVLRLVCLYSDNEYRGIFWPLEAISADLILHDDSVVTDVWTARTLYGDVPENPPKRAQATAAPTKGVDGSEVVHVVGTILTPVTDAIAAEIRKLRADLARERARAADAQKQIEERDRQLQRHAEHLARLETKTQKLEARKP